MAKMLKIGNGSRLFKKFLKFFLVHLIIFAKSWQNFTFFGTFFKKFPKSDQFPWNFSQFSRLHALCGKKFRKFYLDQAKQEQKNFFRQKKIEIHKFFAPPIKFSKKIKVSMRFYVVIISNFCNFSHFFIKFLKRYRYRGVDLAQKRSKKGELGSNLT